MAYRYSLALILSLLMWAAPQGNAQTPTAPQQPANAPAQAPDAQPVDDKSTPPPSGLSMDQILDRVVAKENAMVTTLAAYRPLVETYIQNMTGDEQLGAVPKGDHYFIGKLDLQQGVNH